MLLCSGFIFMLCMNVSYKTTKKKYKSAESEAIFSRWNEFQQMMFLKKKPG